MHCSPIFLYNVVREVRNLLETDSRNRLDSHHLVRCDMIHDGIISYRRFFVKHWQIAWGNGCFPADAAKTCSSKPLYGCKLTGRKGRAIDETLSHDKLQFTVFLDFLFVRGFQNLPTLSVYRRGIAYTFRNDLVFYRHCIDIIRTRPKKSCPSVLCNFYNLAPIETCKYHNQFHKRYNSP